MTGPLFSRRRVLAAGGLGATSLALSGCDDLGSNETFHDTILTGGERLAYRVQRFLAGDRLAPEYSEAEKSPFFRTNGNNQIAAPDYRRHIADGFANWRLDVSGLVEAPRGFSLDELRAMPARTQITRHDCVEGWSAIGGWTGVPLAALLKEVKVKPAARFVVFRCADQFGGINYYESIDLIDAFHPQTILAYAMNGETLPEGHGAPLRLRVERQLGYKQAKFIMRIELVSVLSGIGGGKGGFWEDVADYEWYAGG
ncbi:molybdopterin-dependent oxidoreductase [Consotaella salsifontis]|uniref:DMSO/TMAO reductase YedYZ, molybdopterin-dependent catalytic subunit n=1 Tax=Consotaella salsifontis TaxID=1365950 RepID=A0A1T4P002_9HYPH|nr:molybdopterin-dependent oxidoreductase [Consotaella salsifontis]SJZ84606.1 DMSO/TMAO reductase YedYZ, molybdopterin-dependent catalytic subunit [Consotaella salsifontis]